MRKIQRAIDDAINLIEASLPYLPAKMHAEDAVPILNDLRAIAFEFQLKTFKSNKKKQIFDNEDTVPQDLLD